MKGDIIINMENVRFDGNVLDIGYDNNGIIYNICRCSNNNINIDYFENNAELKNDSNNKYHSCALFITLSELLTKSRKTKLLDVIFNYLDDDGFLYIWDIDKRKGEILDVNIKVILPYRKIKSILHKDYNIFKESNSEITKELLKDKFSIITSKESNGMHFVKAQKKGIGT
ncbi:hypothetical protein SH2C18_21100 [Clostridium sediminicola]|uniref:class I SAM-dependent methyltransferase n=1 Tax=Clostridium sediminicola TaxID=3114879 RepID=UPI0031F24682